MEFLVALRMFCLLSLLTGVAYPLGVTALSQLLFAEQANGQIIGSQSQKQASALLAQKFEDPAYFWPRPSAADYAAVASGASNKGPLSADLKKAIAERANALRLAHGLPASAAVPEELLMTSGSGLDPHLSPAGVRFQIVRVAKARGLSEAQLRTLVDSLIEPRQLGVLGEPRINVLKLNLALNQLPGQTAPQPRPKATAAS